MIGTCGLEGTDGAFHQGIVVTISGAAHPDGDAVGRQQVLVGNGGAPFFVRSLGAELAVERVRGDGQSMMTFRRLDPTATSGCSRIKRAIRLPLQTIPRWRKTAVTRGSRWPTR